MAASTVKQRKYDFQLPLKVPSKSQWELKSDCLREICKAFAKDITRLNRHFNHPDRFPYIRNVSETHGQILLTFEIENVDELETLFQACKSKSLLKNLIHFANLCNIGAKANLKKKDDLVFVVNMEQAEYEYNKVKSLLCKNESEDPKKSSMASSVTGFQLHGSTEPRQSIKDATFKNKSTDVKMCSYDFYLHLQVEKDDVLSVQLLSSSCSELNQLNLEAIPEYEGLWTVHVQVPEDKCKCTIKYQYKVIVRQPVLYIFKQKTTYESGLKFLDGTVQRDCIGDQPFDAYLAHCLHILTLCERINVFECIEQFKRMPLSPSFTVSQKCSLVEMLKPAESVFRSQLILFTIMLFKIFPDIKSFPQMKCITKEMVRAILETFKGENPDKYSEPNQKVFQQFLANFCEYLYGNDYSLLVFISEMYPFFNESIFNEQLADLFKSKGKLCTDDHKNLARVRVIFAVARDRIDSATDSVVAFLSRLFQHLPLYLALQGYSYFYESLFAPSEESHKRIQKQYLSILHTRSENYISKILRKRKVGHLVDFWELVKVEKNLAENMTDTLQKDLINFSADTTVKVSEDESKSLNKLVLDSHLFHDEQSQQQLLKAVGNSKEKNLHDLFINVLCNSKFSDCLIQNQNLLLEWLETALKYHVKGDLNQRIENEICRCYVYLHDALNVLLFPRDDQLWRKLEEYIFKWLSKLNIREVLGKQEEIQKLLEQRFKVLDLHQRHVQQLLLDRYESSRPEDILLSVCGTKAQLRVNSSIIKL